jgi:hypothetical protein
MTWCVCVCVRVCVCDVYIYILAGPQLRSGFGFIFPSPQVRTVGMGRAVLGGGGGLTDEKDQPDEGDEFTDGGSIY